MPTHYLLKTPDLELTEMSEYMSRSDQNFITRQIILNDDDTYDDGFVVLPQDNTIVLLAAKTSDNCKELITKGSATRTASAKV